jgi:hypothetical protein
MQKVHELPVYVKWVIMGHSETCEKFIWIMSKFCGQAMADYFRYCFHYHVLNTRDKFKLNVQFNICENKQL